ncbi:MAG: 50S ribosomal protein L29 [Chloroflexota bacterium]
MIMVMTAEEVRDMSTEDLLDELEDQKEELYRLRFQKATGQLEDVNLLRYTRRTIARIKTIIRERELAAEIAAEEQTDGE